ncbi:YchJ family protein [Vibrio sp. SM6]|uniref:UPF0225 protein HGP28_00855 n=1 Tax=Vibrio agarilyticus TaxID=2726741 RepID=A0A7X8TMF4_9VIBR|nr:YchJ family protein [Vibrio agarilyticus]
MVSFCSCGSNLSYSACCEVAHLDHAAVHTPEQLMRSRYSAHVLGLVDYVVATYHPSCHADDNREAIADSINSDWRGLDVVKTEAGDTADEGFVSFNAYFAESGTVHCLSERSRFIRENGLWYYIDGTYSDTPFEISAERKNSSMNRLQTPVANLKIGRNDPCLCGSGKKFKKCCG